MKEILFIISLVPFIYFFILTLQSKAIQPRPIFQLIHSDFISFIINLEFLSFVFLRSCFLFWICTIEKEIFFIFEFHSIFSQFKSFPTSKATNLTKHKYYRISTPTLFFRSNNEALYRHSNHYKFYQYLTYVWWHGVLYIAFLYVVEIMLQFSAELLSHYCKSHQYFTFHRT